jgi:hypothetical protein
MREVAVSPARRRSLKDAARDPLTAKKPVPAPKGPRKRETPAKKMPVLAKLAIGMLLGFAGGFLAGRFSRWI